MAEPVTMAIGVTIAKGVFRLVFPDSDLAAVVGDGLIDLIGKSRLDYKEKKSAGRQFERIADKAAEALIPFIENEWQSLPDNDKLAAILAASAAIGSTEISLQTLSSQNYDPAKLYAQVCGSLDNRLLSDASDKLCQQLVRQSCQLIIDLSSTFPAFDLETYREILNRESSIIEAVDKIFGEFHKIRELSSRASDSFSDTYFEDAYRKAIGRELDIIELFGVDTQTRVSSRHHNLTAAYISLSVSGMHSAEHDNRAGDGASDNTEESINTKEFSSLKVEQAVFGSARIVLRGDAGSGKTTLLQSLAVRCATASFSSEMSQWNDLLPFFIRLRALGTLPLPAPEQFPGLVAPSIAGTMPNGWVHRQLKKGRALLLIDGLDEITSEKRDSARNWIKELVGAYPDCRVIVTSRPAVVSDSWLKSNEFSHMDLMPMSPDDVNSFIDHWHDAVQKEEVDISKKDIVGKLPAKLKERIRGDRALRELASTPLLCAMLCAMNRDKREVLPATRIALYDAAVSMILHGRDEQRRIKMHDLPDVDYDSKFALLQEIALWMMENNWSMADKWRLTEYVETIIKKFPRLSGFKTNNILDLLLQRSGILRSPVEGKIDFIHNAFKEFLCAKGIAGTDNFSYLLNNLNKESWREVATIAPAMTDERRRSEFIGMLLQMGDANIKRRSMYHLLAVRCLETCTSLSFELQSEIRERIGKLRPPANFSEARAISSAGEMALPLLVCSSAIKARTAASCVRALRYIGTANALDKITEFASDTRLTVLPEIMSAWPFFDREEYAKKVLSRSPEFSTRFGVSSLSMLEGIRHLSGLKALRIYGSGLPLLDSHYLELSFLKQLQNLRVHRVESVDLGRLSNLINMETLTIAAEGIGNVSALQRWGGLKSLWLASAVAPMNVADLVDVDGLRSIYISAPNIVGFDQIKGNTTPREISLFGKFNPRNLSSLSRLPSLDLISSTFAGTDDDMSYVGSALDVEKINFRHATEIKKLDGFARISKLRALTLRECHNLIDLSSLATMPNLKQLHLWGARRLKNLSAVGDLKQLTVLTLGVSKEVDDLEFVSNLPALKVIHAPARLAPRLMELRPDITISERIPMELRLSEMHREVV